MNYVSTMKQALEYLDSPSSKLWPAGTQYKIINALRLAIEQAEKQEPVAWKNAAMRLGEKLSSVGPEGYYDMTAEQWLNWAMDQRPTGKQSLQVEPVAWWREDGSICVDERQATAHDIPLYTDRRLIPRDYTAPPQRQPLTDKQWVQSELFKLAVKKGLLSIHTDHVAAPQADPATKVSWMEGHAGACDISNEAAHGIGGGE